MLGVGGLDSLFGPAQSGGTVERLAVFPQPDLAAQWYQYQSQLRSCTIWWYC